MLTKFKKELRDGHGYLIDVQRQRAYRWSDASSAVGRRFCLVGASEIERAVMMGRAGAYIDGFNLYFGMKDRRWRGFYWLDLRSLARDLIAPHHIHAYTKYFTARVTEPVGKVKRQNTYLEALATLADVELIFGQYRRRTTVCRACGALEEVPKEKMTDVNIAVTLLRDAIEDKFDMALVVSGDSDLAPAFKAVHELRPDKQIIVAFPPERVSEQLRGLANGNLVIGRAKLKRNQLPDQVVRSDGYVLNRPEHWVKQRLDE